MNAPNLIKRPAGLAGLSARVFDALANHTVFPWALMEYQCRRIGKDPMALTAADLRDLAPLLAEAVARFTSPARRATVLAELSILG